MLSSDLTAFPRCLKMALKFKHSKSPWIVFIIEKKTLKILDCMQNQSNIEEDSVTGEFVCYWQKN